VTDAELDSDRIALIVDDREERLLLPADRLEMAEAALAVGGIACLLVTDAHAQIDEIQIYDADINSPGQFSVQLHNNYTPIGRKLPDFEGRIGPNHTLNGVPEWAYGVADWLELGVYVPVYSCPRIRTSYAT
jgi:hypothetical protein